VKLEIAVFFATVRTLLLGYEIPAGTTSLTVKTTGTTWDPLPLLKLTGTVVAAKIADTVLAENTPVVLLKLIPATERAVALAAGIL
jgi:hypothetical protein